MSEIERLLRQHIPLVPAYTTARSQFGSGLLLDANENALGPQAPGLPADLNRYPDPANGELRGALADWLGVSADHLWFGNGSDEVIDLLIRVLVAPGAPVVVIEPSYGVYSQRAAAHGAAVRAVRLDDCFDLDVDATVAAADGSSLILLCSPNNPTGALLSPDRILEVLCRTRSVLALDEAYVEFAGRTGRSDSMAGLAGNAMPESIPQAQRLAVLRTFSKAWGLAGARVGYLVGTPGLVDAMNRVGLPYPLSSLSARAALEAVSNRAGMEEARDILVKERGRLVEGLAELGVRSLPSDANFLLFFVDRPREVQRQLARQHGVIIRDRSDMPGLEGGLRVTVGSPPDNDRFLEALREVLS